MKIIESKNGKKKIELTKEECETVIAILWSNSLFFFDSFTLKLQETLKKKRVFKISKKDSNKFLIPYSDGIGKYEFKISTLKKYC